MKELDIETKRGSILDGVLFCQTKNPDTVLITITGIHGNFFSNPFYYNFGETLNKGNIDFIYAQTCDALGREKKLIKKLEKKSILAPGMKISKILMKMWKLI